MNLRDDLQLIYDWIPAGIRVLERAVMAGGRRVSCLPNLMGSLAFYRVG